MVVDVRKNLAKATLRTGKSLAQLSRAVGKNDAYLQQFIKKGSPRELPEKVRRTLARILEIPEQDLGAEETPLPLFPKEIDLQRVTRIPVMGEVRAGAWLELDSAYAERDEELAVSVPEDGNIRGMYGLVVVGDSMNKKCAPGSIVAVVNIADSGAEVKNDDIVVVERHQGGLVEVTLKRYRIESDGTHMLYPESTNPSHKPFPADQSESNYEIVIKAIATGVYTSL